jgi:hypothetical protein
MQTLPDNPDLTAGLRPEIELLLGCARGRIAPEAADRLRGLLRSEIDWPFLIRKAHQHGSLSLLCWNLSNHFADAVPEPAMRQLRTQFQANAQQNLGLTRELRQLIHLLEEHEVGVIPYKGPVLAAQLYGDLLLRQCSDLDILVRREDVPRATELLAARSFHPKRPLAVPEATYLRDEYARSFVRAEDQMVLELHWTIRPRYCAFRIDPAQFWAGHQWTSVAGTRVRTLAPEDLLLILCVHASWHLWGRLQWISDIAELVRTYPGIDWPRMLTQAQALGSRRMVLLGLLLASSLLDVPLPVVVSEQIQADPAITSLAVFACDRLLHETGERPRSETKMAERAYLLRMRERWPDRLGYCLHLARDVVPPSQHERTALPLPPLLSPLYYVMRPFRLAGKYGPLLLQRRR